MASLVDEARRIWDRWYPRLVIATSASTFTYAVAVVAGHTGR